eukprot:TRINITY_DN16866_c0_g1_i3.p1 TRINITY_DN16866_c0_g1~~TRINITY_DN16866_c0_g1_i3.p1  ORF type:complete len:140 (+),score=22.70 TRINITY_DN16866_c0_g1_i3:447-866(+)
MSGGVKDVRIERVRIWDSAEGLRLKTGMGRGGYIENITMQDVVMENAATGFMYNCNYGGHPEGYNKSAVPTVRAVAVWNVRGIGCDRVADLEGLPERPMTDISFDQVHFDVGDYKCSEVSGSWKDVDPVPCPALTPTRD